MPSIGSEVGPARSNRSRYSARGRRATVARATASCVIGRWTKVSPHPATYAGETRSERASPTSPAIDAARSSSSGPIRSRGAADSSTYPSENRTPIRPAPQTWETTSPVRRPRARSAQAVPRVGCPANGISPPGAKILVAYSRPSVTSVAGNVVSEKLNSFAIARHCSVLRSSAPWTTASWLPANGWSVNTSTRSKLSDMATILADSRRPLTYPDVSTSPSRVFAARLAGLPVFDPQGDQVGKVRDLVVALRTGVQQPRVLGLVVEVFGRRKIFVPMTRVTSVDSGQIITTGLVNMRRFEQRPTETLVFGQLLDRNVRLKESDVQGTVYDVAMEQARNRDWVLSRVALQEGSKRFGRKGQTHVVAWRDVDGLALPEEGQGAAHLLAALEEMRPADFANVIHDLPAKRRGEIAAALDNERLADVLEELPEEDQVEILGNLDSERAADILEEMSPDDAADLIAELPPETAKHL